MSGKLGAVAASVPFVWAFVSKVYVSVEVVMMIEVTRCSPTRVMSGF